MFTCGCCSISEGCQTHSNIHPFRKSKVENAKSPPQLFHDYPKKWMTWWHPQFPVTSERVPFSKWFPSWDPGWVFEDGYHGQVYYFAGGPGVVVKDGLMPWGCPWGRRKHDLTSAANFRCDTSAPAPQTKKVGGFATGFGIENMLALSCVTFQQNDVCYENRRWWQYVRALLRQSMGTRVQNDGGFATIIWS